MGIERWTIKGQNLKQKCVSNDNDIIVAKRVTKTVYRDNEEIKKHYYIKRNVTQEVNETAKLLKIETINEKAEQIEQILKEENNNKGE